MKWIEVTEQYFYEYVEQHSLRAKQDGFDVEYLDGTNTKVAIKLANHWGNDEYKILTSPNLETTLIVSDLFS